MEDNRFKDIFECFLHNYSGNEYAGFTPEDSHEMGDSSAASVQQDPLWLWNLWRNGKQCIGWTQSHLACGVLRWQVQRTYQKVCHKQTIFSVFHWRSGWFSGQWDQLVCRASQKKDSYCMSCAHVVWCASMWNELFFPLCCWQGLLNVHLMTYAGLLTPWFTYTGLLTPQLTYTGLLTLWLTYTGLPSPWLTKTGLLIPQLTYTGLLTLWLTYTGLPIPWLTYASLLTLGLTYTGLPTPW